MFTATSATYKVAALTKRLRAVAGGTSASKTISILLVLIQMSIKDKSSKTTHIVSESLPHLKLAAMADFLRIMKEHQYYQEDQWNRSDYIYTFESGSTIQFYGADSPQKVHGPRRDRLFVNEANNVPFESFDQMEVRTKDIVFLDWNPTSEFWFYTEVLPTRKQDLDFITLTYKDNESLPESIVNSIESRKHNTAWWNVYGLGQLGEIEGRIYTAWQIIDEIPFEARLIRRYLDFGYSVDPSAIGDIYHYNGGYIVKERLYQRNYLNSQLADFLLTLPQPNILVMADSAEPKSIEEIKRKGVNILGAIKGPGSVKAGIDKVQQQRISVTADSPNIIHEYKNYMWKIDKRTGKNINEPEEGEDHHMKGICYGFDGLNERRDTSAVRTMQQRALAGRLY